MLYNSGNDCIKLLWSRHEVNGAGRHMLGAPALLILAGIYIPLACLLAGAIVPTGLIVPVLLVGGTCGRLVGLLASWMVISGAGEDQDCDGLPSCHTGWNWVDPGAFAIYGSAAFCTRHRHVTAM